MTRWQPPEPKNLTYQDSLGREVTYMSDYEIFMIVLGIIGLLISSSLLHITLLNFLDKRNSKRK